jgi:RNA polymerase subunit RPABC4/transcription elongation factor Spt4
MQVKTEKQTRFGNELRLIPGWAWVLAAVGFACMQFIFNVILPRDPDAPPLWGRIAFGLLTGLVLGCYVLLIGYVNGDAGRRRMNRLLWTLLAIFVPNGLGIILYFLLRHPLPTSCRQCGSTVQPGSSYCPRCGTNLTQYCPRCRHSVQADDIYCTSCGNPLRTTDPPLPTAPAQ